MLGAGAHAVAVAPPHPDGGPGRCAPPRGRRFWVSPGEGFDGAAGSWVQLRHGRVNLIREPDGACTNGERVRSSTTELDIVDYLPFVWIELEQLLVVDRGAGTVRQHPDLSVADGDRARPLHVAD